MQAVRSHSHEPPADLIAAIFKDLDKFNTTLFDDQTVLAMKVK